MKQYVKEIVHTLCSDPCTKIIETRKYVYYLQGVDYDGFVEVWRCNSYLFHQFPVECYDRELVAKVPVKDTYLRYYL